MRMTVESNDASTTACCARAPGTASHASRAIPYNNRMDFFIPFFLIPGYARRLKSDSRART